MSDKRKIISNMVEVKSHVHSILFVKCVFKRLEYVDLRILVVLSLLTKQRMSSMSLWKITYEAQYV